MIQDVMMAGSGKTERERERGRQKCMRTNRCADADPFVCVGIYHEGQPISTYVKINVCVRFCVFVIVVVSVIVCLSKKLLAIVCALHAGNVGQGADACQDSDNLPQNLSAQSTSNRFAYWDIRIMALISPMQTALSLRIKLQTGWPVGGAYCKLSLDLYSFSRLRMLGTLARCLMRQPYQRQMARGK